MGKKLAMMRGGETLIAHELAALIHAMRQMRGTEHEMPLYRVYRRLVTFAKKRGYPTTSEAVAPLVEAVERSKEAIAATSPRMGWWGGPID